MYQLIAIFILLITVEIYIDIKKPRFTPYRIFKIIKVWWLKRRFNKAIRILDVLDWHFKDINWNRQKRRQFWSEFVKSVNARNAVLNHMTQQARQTPRINRGWILNALWYLTIIPIKNAYKRLTRKKGRLV